MVAVPSGGLPDFVDVVAAPAPQSRASAYMAKAEAKLFAARQRRLRHLQSAVTRAAFRRATERLGELAHPDRDYVAIRSAFIHGRRLQPAISVDGIEQPSTPPPLTDLLGRKNQHAIALYLTMLFVEQMDAARDGGEVQTPRPQRRRRGSVYNPDDGYSDASLIGLPSTQRRNQRRMLTRALDALHAVELVDLAGSGQRYINRAVNREDGSGRPYAAPAGEPSTHAYLCLPTAFFTSGWPLVLTPSELATFLAVCHCADRKLPVNPDGSTPRRMYLAKSLRESQLGLSDEAYESIHELGEFGLIQVQDPVEGRRRGRVPPEMLGGKRPDPYQLIPTVLGGFPSWDRAFALDAFTKPAIDTAIERLSQPIPRYAQWAGTARNRPTVQVAGVRAVPKA